jgi:hypothetical protein
MTTTSYMAAHDKTRRVRGRAAEQICAHRGGKAREWAYSHEDPEEFADSHGRRFSAHPDQYVALCKHCHQVFDKALITRCPKGHPYEGANLLIDAGKRKCRTCVYARNRQRKPTAAQKARRIELQRIRRAKARSAA